MTTSPSHATHRQPSTQPRGCALPTTPDPAPVRRQGTVPLAVAMFVAAVVAANALTARYGLTDVGFGPTATAGTWAAGLTLLVRDWVHHTGGRRVVLACICVCALASAVWAGPRLAVASAAAFAVSELTDLLIYQRLRQRGWIRAALASNVVGAPPAPGSVR